MQNKIEIQNNLYLEVRNEKDKYLNERRKLYLSNELKEENVEEITEDDNAKSVEIEVSKEEKFILNLNRLIEQQIKAHLDNIKVSDNKKEKEDEMEQEDNVYMENKEILQNLEKMIQETFSDPKNKKFSINSVKNV